MSVSEELITKIVLLLPNNPTIDALMATDSLKGVRAAEIYAALRILDERKLVRLGEVFGWDNPPQ